MAQTFPLPKWGVTMEEGTIIEWTVQPGATVEVDDVIAQVETDKITVEFVAPVKGILAAHLVEVGTTVECGAPIVVIADDEQDYEAFRATAGG
jgi:pyruvate/2-oxoglutarate dehydrogenase complex dihydrolipoamide acyltransferase (E2) component